jgi:hypothetical protein
MVLKWGRVLRMEEIFHSLEQKTMRTSWAYESINGFLNYNLQAEFLTDYLYGCQTLASLSSWFWLGITRLSY